jgi:hypothetical protein
MTNKEIYDRIRSHYGLDRNVDFANRLGVSPQQANAIVNRVNLDYDLIHEKFPEVSPEWLLSKGERGEMIAGYQSVTGNNNNVAGRDVKINEDLAHALDLAQQSLLNEQATCRKLQAQMDGMLEIMKNMTATGRTTTPAAQ